MVRLDAYTATTRALRPNDAVHLLLEHGDQVKHARGQSTFAEQYRVEDEWGRSVGSVNFGGKLQGDRVMIEVKGERTPSAVERLRQAAEHRCTRVDSCADFDAPGAFSRLLEACLEVKRDHRLYGDRRGDWDDHPELGRTQYLGATSSPIRARLYEKGRQPEYVMSNRPDWVRLEIQVRPQKDAKDEYSRLSAIDVWGASKWTRQLAANVLQEHIDPHPPGTIRRETQRDRALRYMAMQYGKHLVSLADDLGGWEVLGLTLREMIDEARRDQV